MYNFWKKNKRQVSITITHINHFHVRAVRKQNKINEIPLDNLYAKIQLPLWISLLEIEFNLLISGNEHFTQKFINEVNLKNATEIAKWIALITYYFKEDYLGGQRLQLTKLSIGDTAYHRYNTLISIIEKDLKPFVELRNRLAHGQWAIAFNSDCLEKNQDLTTNIWRLSKKDLMLLKSLIKNITILANLLITSKNAFERDYDKYAGKITKAKEDADLKFMNLLRKKKA